MGDVFYNMENNEYLNLKPAKNSIGELYIKGNSQMSISRGRSNMIIDYLQIDKDFKITFRDTVSNAWTKHQHPSKFKSELISFGYDMHRSMLYNELIIEADYETYQENLRAAQYIGTQLENLGFKPAYYFSGSKSIHIHVFIDFTGLFILPQRLQEEILCKFESKQVFIREFMLWLRTEFITCDGLETYAFDKAFLSPSHMVRAELSLNKKGFKTYIGKFCQDLPSSPIYCTIENMEYPERAEYIESFYKYPEVHIQDFLNYYNKILIERNNRSKKYAGLENKPKKVRASVKLLLAEVNIPKIIDGRKRIMFVLCNELKQVYTLAEAEQMMLKWNSLLPEPLEEKDIRFRINSTQKYKVSNKFVEDLVFSLGFTKEDIDEHRKPKVYK
jgi:hypothetical protein